MLLQRLRKIRDEEDEVIAQRALPLCIIKQIIKAAFDVMDANHVPDPSFMNSNIEGVKSHLGLDSRVCVSHLPERLRAEARGHVPVIPHSSSEERWGGRAGVATPRQTLFIAAVFQMTNCNCAQHLPAFPQHTHTHTTHASQMLVGNNVEAPFITFESE